MLKFKSENSSVIMKTFDAIVGRTESILGKRLYNDYILFSVNFNSLVVQLIMRAARIY